MREKIHSYLGFAKKSRNLISGYNSCLHGVGRGKVYLVILTEDLSENTKEKFISIAESENIPLRFYGNMEKMQEMTGEMGRGIYGITEKNLAKAIIDEIDKCRQSGKKEV
jgi:ribosomal protein L7Ae-like RNA K-turn-binding protein